MPSAFIMIGNSDNRLTQQQWASFQGDLVGLLDELMEDGATVQGVWFSEPMSIYQNMAVCVQIPPDTDDWRPASWLRKHLGTLAHAYNQNSIALYLGDPAFVLPLAGEEAA